MNRRMIKAYFAQDSQYYSESKGEFLPIGKMNWRHARNTAAKLYREADFWCKEIGEDPEHAEAYVSTTPLYQALARRAMGI